MSDIKKKQTFKDYYDSNPEFKSRHNAKMSEKVICECGFETSRSNLTRHKKSHLHTKRLEKNKNQMNAELLETSQELIRLSRLIEKSLMKK